MNNFLNTKIPMIERKVMNESTKQQNREILKRGLKMLSLYEHKKQKDRQNKIRNKLDLLYQEIIDL